MVDTPQPGTAGENILTLEDGAAAFKAFTRTACFTADRHAPPAPSTSGPARICAAAAAGLGTPYSSHLGA